MNFVKSLSVSCLLQYETIMNRWFCFLAVCGAIWGIDARPQAGLPFVDSSIEQTAPAIIPIRRPLFLLRPNGQILFIPDGIPMNYNVQTPMFNPLPDVPNDPLPLAIFPFPNQFDPSVFSNGFFKQSTTTPVSSSNSPDPEIQSSTATSPTVNTQQATTTPTAVTQPSGVASSPSVPQSTTSNPLPTVITSSAPSTLEQEANGDYSFRYSVNDKETGDIKSQEEKKVNGIVTGYYWLAEADGTFRKVDYTADDQGFRATVSKLLSIDN